MASLSLAYAPAIHAFLRAARKTWIRGSSPRMTFRARAP
jgi:hypothetical protein